MGPLEQRKTSKEKTELGELAAEIEKELTALKRELTGSQKQKMQSLLDLIHHTFKSDGSDGVIRVLHSSSKRSLKAETSKD